MKEMAMNAALYTIGAVLWAMEHPIKIISKLVDSVCIGVIALAAMISDFESWTDMLVLLAAAVVSGWILVSKYGDKE